MDILKAGIRNLSKSFRWFLNSFLSVITFPYFLELVISLKLTTQKLKLKTIFCLRSSTFGSQLWTTCSWILRNIINNSNIFCPNVFLKFQEIKLIHDCIHFSAICKKTDVHMCLSLCMLKCKGKMHVAMIKVN